MTEIRHIVFDVGKVLVHYDPHQAYHDLIPDAAEREAFLRDVCSSAWNHEQDRGRAWEEAEAEAIAPPSRQARADPRLPQELAPDGQRTNIRRASRSSAR